MYFSRIESYLLIMEKKYSPMDLTRYWLEEVVIGLDLCPFAKQPYQKGLVRLIENESASESDQLSFFLDELNHLQQTSFSKLSTTLIIFTNSIDDFEDFNDFVGLCEDMLNESGLEEHFQLVAFHPQFILADIEMAHRSHWIGRSPFPIVHILRNSEIEIAQASNIDVKGIPFRNEEKLINMSEKDFQKLFFYLK